MVADQQRNEPSFLFMVLTLIAAIVASDIAKQHMRSNAAVGVAGCMIVLLAVARRSGVLAMFLRLLTILILLISSIRGTAQSPEIRRTDFEIPGGSIFGAALSNNGTVMYAQQYLFDDSTSAGRQRVVKISSWDIREKVLLASKSFSESQRSQTFPCRRTLFGVTSGNLYVCSDRFSIRILDGKELTTLRTLQYPAEGTIRDFAIDEAHDRIYLLADHANGAITLEEMLISTGKKTNGMALDDSPLAYSPLAYSSASRLLTVAFTRTGGFGQKTDLIFYDASTLSSVRKIADLPRLDSLLFVSSKLIAAPGYLGFKKSDCLLSFDLQTFESDNYVCAPKTGVDFSVASVSNAYLVAATGVNRPKLFSDAIESVSSSLSIWGIETKKLLTTMTLPDGFTSALAGVTIVGSAGGCFVAYQSSGVSPVVISACIPEKSGDSHRTSLSSSSHK
jgi:hypothetical protein